MSKTLEHIENLTRHLDLVREGCLLLGKRLIEKGEDQLGVQLIARGYRHDNSKFFGIEFDYLHNGPDTPDKELRLAIDTHQSHNDHHPEFWPNGIEDMSRIHVAEMLVDWYARAQEFGTSLREWIDKTAIDKYDIGKRSKHHKWIKEFVDLLLQDSFKH